MLGAAITAALPPGFRRRLMVTCDGAKPHDLIARLDKLAARPGYQVIYSVGWALGEREKAAITACPGGPGRSRSMEKDDGPRAARRGRLR